MTTLLKGLSADAVAEQQRAGNVNKTPDSSSKSAARIVAENIFTYFNGIFALLAGLVIYTGSYKSLTFLPAIIANTIIGIVQQLRAKQVLDKLSLLATVEATVVRDGQESKIPVDQLVLGDIVYLEAGQQVPADAEVVEGKAAVNEALLTGESDEIDKKLGDELMSGSFVASGSCYARLTRVGANSYAAKLTAQAKQIKDKQSEMVAGINLFVKVAGFAIIPIGGALVWEDLFLKGRTMAESINAMVSAVTGMIPEGLYLLVTIALTLSAARLARKKVLLHDMRSTEALARVDVLCVDKTGTITTNDMTVTEVFPAVDKPEYADFYMRLLAQYVSTITDSNTTMRALKRHFADTEPFEDAEITPFSSQSKYSQIKVGNFILRFGAPEFLLSPDEMEANREIIEQRTSRGERVLALTGALKHDEFIAMS
ncbi:MAG: HAD-IC family P-type ATPase, partial [Coriobacteriales bacterium]|nr:HAD-IC family P-type ATPase [Coriobacteriales bacterium]